jgi:hypothetical protein
VRAKDSDVGGVAQVQLNLTGLMGGADEEFVREVGDLLQEDTDPGALVIELELGKGGVGSIVESSVDDQEQHQFEILLVAIGTDAGVQILHAVIRRLIGILQQRLERRAALLKGGGTGLLRGALRASASTISASGKDDLGVGFYSCAERVLPHAIHLEPLAEIPDFWVPANDFVYLAFKEIDALRIFDGSELHGAIVAV